MRIGFGLILAVHRTMRSCSQACSQLTQLIPTQSGPVPAVTHTAVCSGTETASSSDTVVYRGTDTTLHTGVHHADQHAHPVHKTHINIPSTVPIATDTNGRQTARPPRGDTFSQPRPSVPPPLNSRLSTRPVRMKRPPARLLSHLHATKPQPLCSSASIESARAYHISKRSLNCFNISIMQSAGDHRSCSRTRAQSPSTSRRRRPHHNTLPRPCETEDDRRRHVTAQCRNRESTNPSFTPRRCRLCGN